MGQCFSEDDGECKNKVHDRLKCFNCNLHLQSNIKEKRPFLLYNKNDYKYIVICLKCHNLKND